jgi:hypothetical protein
MKRESATATKSMTVTRAEPAMTAPPALHLESPFLHDESFAKEQRDELAPRAVSSSPYQSALESDGAQSTESESEHWLSDTQAHGASEDWLPDSAELLVDAPMRGPGSGETRDADNLLVDSAFEEVAPSAEWAAAPSEGAEESAIDLDPEEYAAAAQFTAASLEAVDQFEPEAPSTHADMAGQEASEPLTLEAEAAPSDQVDAFLESRRSLYKVVLVGTNIHVTLPRSHDWTARYTSRALTEGAVGAAVNVIYMGGASAAQVRKAYEQVIGRGVKLTPATQQMYGEGAIHLTIIDDAARAKIADVLNLPPKGMGEAWRAKFGEAKLLEFALGSASRSFDRLVPHLSAKTLAASRMNVDLVRYLLDKRAQSMIEVAKRHPAAAPWREAFERNLALHWAEREPVLSDLDKVPLSQWAKTVLDLATATRNTLAEQITRRREEDRKHARNEHLQPHEIAVDDAAKFILENFDPTRKERLHTTSWIVHGGQQLSNIKGEPILLLRVDSDRVIYQHLGNKKFYEQTLEGFGEEQLYGIYVEAGKKSKGAIALSKWVISLAGAVFPPVRYGLMATDVLNAAFKLEANRAALEQSYVSMKLAYSNIDLLLPGVLPKIWDAVLDKQNAALFNPLKNPDLGAWLKVLIRIILMRTARGAGAEFSQMANMTWGREKGPWAAIKKALGVLWEVVKHAIVVGTAVAGSTGVSGQRALDLAQQRLSQLGVIDAVAIVGQIRRLSRADGERLAREIQDLANNGTKLMDVVVESLSW